MEEKTIAAISTPIGVGGISVIRLSGAKSLNIALQVFSCNFKKQNDQLKPSLTITDNKVKHITANEVTLNKVNKSLELKDADYIEPRKLYLGKFKAANFTEICLMVYFKAPFSYTGEDVVEFQCHGGLLIAQGILNELILKGAALADPGEFTKRAFMNGKLTLDEAEGVIDMINAESESEVRAGYNLLEGSLSKEIKSIQNQITNMLASIEVTLDYPEVDYEEQTAKNVYSELESINDRIKHLINTSSTGMLIKNGTRVLILGKPNVGKSSLLNAMLNFDRAIVTSVQGTTRDIIEETYTYNGVKFILTDTAGLRNSYDEVEKIGIEKAKRAINSSDVVLLVVDGSEQLTNEDFEIIKLLEHKKVLTIINKTDLQQKIDILQLPKTEVLKVSAENKQGIEELKQKIYNLVIDGEVASSNLMITNARHLEVLKHSLELMQIALNGLEQKFSLDLISIDIKNLWLKLGEITGETNNEEIINTIFSNFCLGK